LNVNLLTGLLGGGAANAAKQLHRGLLQQGVRSRLYYALRLKEADVPPQAFPARWGWSGSRLTKYLGFRAQRSHFKRQVRGRPAGNEIFTSPRGAAETVWPPTNHPANPNDILHLHWVAKFIDYESFFRSLGPDQPVVWTLHDMNPFTGGCHFTDHCQRFVDGCGDCPQLPSPAPDDISRRFFEIKRRALADVNLHVVAASRWMLEQARRSPIFRHARSFHRIPYGLRLDLYRPVDRLRARAELNLPADAFVFSFGAADVNNRRKGAALLLDALQRVADLDGVRGLVLGGGDLPQVVTPLPPLQSMGFVQEVHRRVLIYSACDAFVLPSTEDNMPLTGLEAMAAGTPIVGFDAGGIPDFTRPGQTGLLAPSGDAGALGEQLRYLYQHRDQAAAMGRRAREVIESEYSDTREAADYIGLYAALLGGTTDCDETAGLTDSM
jgi:glycosyltransferase involved in cell wall biosynthesis